jgi:hypothetical protein
VRNLLAAGAVGNAPAGAVVGHISNVVTIMKLLDALND